MADTAPDASIACPSIRTGVVTRLPDAGSQTISAWRAVGEAGDSGGWVWAAGGRRAGGGDGVSAGDPQPAPDSSRPRVPIAQNRRPGPVIDLKEPRSPADG